MNIESPQGVAALGEYVRRTRKAQGLTLHALGRRAGLGIRFLSEFERGKPTAELGKALAALAALDLKWTLISGAAQAGASPESLSPRPPPLAEGRGLGAVRPVPVTSPPGPRPARGGDAARIWDMVVVVAEASGLVRACAADPELRDSMILKRALERCFDVLGEAARRVTPESQRRFREIPWREIITRRNGLVLSYECTDHGALYCAAQSDLPELETRLQAALSALDAPAAG